MTLFASALACVTGSVPDGAGPAAGGVGREHHRGGRRHGRPDAGGRQGVDQPQKAPHGSHRRHPATLPGRGGVMSSCHTHMCAGKRKGRSKRALALCPRRRSSESGFLFSTGSFMSGGAWLKLTPSVPCLCSGFVLRLCHHAVDFTELFYQSFSVSVSACALPAAACPLRDDDHRCSTPSSTTSLSSESDSRG